MDSTRIAHYELGRLLGRGGMGEVFEAEDLTLGRRVALKFLAAELASDADSLARFEREARSAAALTHPNIATLYAFERDGERRFISMELVGGETLRDRIRRGPLAVDEALGVTRDVASALAAAHARGIVHRDIKPENLMFDERGAVKVMDFGLARAVQAARLTMTGTTMGTAAYMAPESVRGEVGPKADVFALGAVLFEMLTGDLPFAGENPLALMYTIANEEPKSVRAARPDVPEAVEALVRRVLIKNPEERPDAETLARELASLTGSALPALRSTTEELEVVHVPKEGEAALAPFGPRRRRLIWPLLVLASFVIAYLVHFLMVGGRQKEAARHREAVLHNNRGMEALNAGALDDARREFLAAIGKEQTFASAYLNLGVVALRQERAAEAESLYLLVIDRFAKNRADSAAVFFNMAELDTRTGTWPSAVDNLQKSFALDSSNAAVYSTLSYALIMSGRAAEARPLLDRAARTYTNEPLLYKNAGIAALRLGDPKAALVFLERAMALDSSITSTHGLRARALESLGMSGQAEREWEKFRARSPDSSTSVEVEEGMIVPRAHPAGVVGHPPDVGVHPPRVGMHRSPRVGTHR